MFDLPDAKRVRREELRPSSTSPSPEPESLSPEAIDAATSRLSAFFSLDTYTPETYSSTERNKDKAVRESGGADGEQEQEEQEFEFRLFSAPAPRRTPDVAKEQNIAGETETPALNGAEGKTPVQKLRIRVRSPSPGAPAGEGRFVVPFRGWRYYVSDPALLGMQDDSASKEQRQREERVAQAAVSGELVREWATKPWSGCSYPWRIRILKQAPNKKLSAANAAVQPRGQNHRIMAIPADAAAASKRKPGKKRRAVLRSRQQKVQDEKEKDQEKRNRRNREKKIKRRQREREKKAAAAGAGGADPAVAPAGDAQDEHDDTA